LSLENLNRLRDLTGMGHRTLQARLASLTPAREGKSLLYESRDALPLLYQVRDVARRYDLEEERARLSHHQANLAALDEEVKKKNLIPADVVLERWQTVIANVRARLLSIPSQLAATCENAPRQQIEDKASDMVRLALEELSDADS
jgi:phage terminase Nu1 subunit (DNA packaging protein)